MRQVEPTDRTLLVIPGDLVQMLQPLLLYSIPTQPLLLTHSALQSSK